MSPKATATRIAQLRASEAEYVELIRAACAEALACGTSSGYDKHSKRAGELERIALRIATERQGLEARLLVASR